MLDKIPKVSIIMATYNREHYILESIQSIQAQTFKDWECIIVDDGGTDATRDILAPVFNEDPRFQYFTRTSKYQKGLPGSRNYGLDLARGDYIIFFDDDDIAHPQNLEFCVSEFSKREISFCRYIRTVFKGDFHYNYNFSKEFSHFNIDERDINKILKNELLFNSCSIMWKKECFVNNRFIEHLMYAEEWELYSRIITNGFKGISIDKILFYGRKHEESNTGEFFKQDPIRLKSNANAIVLVLKNLKQQNLLSDEIIRYFVQVSLNYKQYGLYKRIMEVMNLQIYKKIKWMLTYYILPFRLYFYSFVKKYKK